MTYNENEYNQAPYGGAAPIDVAESSDVFQFDSYGLQNSSIITSDIDFSTAPQRDFETDDYPRSRGQLLIDEQWRKRVITLKGHLRADTAAELEQLIDTVKKRLSTRNGNLDITITGWNDTRRWVATLQNPEKLFAKREAFHITTCPFEAQFLCLDPHGYDEDYTNLSLFNRTVATTNYTITNDGTAPSELILILSINTLATFASLTVTNNTTGESMQITDALAAGNIIDINSEDKTVEVDGSAFDFAGQFISLNAGDNDIEITLASSSHDFDVTYKHKNAYL
jgi:hypothetical protein